MSTPIVWYRPSPLKGIIKFAIFSAVQMMTGVILMALGLDLSSRVGEVWQPFLFVLGIAIVIGGVCTAGMGFPYVLSKDNAILIVQTDGLVFEKQGKKVFFDWNSINTIQGTPKTLTIKTNTGETFDINERFVGAKNPHLAETISEMRRKILLGMMPS